MAEPPPVRRRSRVGLYAPFILLLVVAVGWSVAWYVIRGRVDRNLDEWIARESAEGRQWTCADRTVGGYPFRIEVGCSSFALQRPDVQARFGRLVIVTQAYDIGHVIAEATGPLHVTAPGTQVDATWRLLQASVVVDRNRFERGAVVVDEPAVTATTPDITNLKLAAKRYESHLRPDPAEATTFDWSASFTGAVVPGLDDLIGGNEPADIDLVLDVTKALDLPARPLWSELERWRAAGGQVDITRLAVTKGRRRIQAAGLAGIDEAHRPQGRLDVAALGLEGLVGRYTGDRGIIGGLLGALAGGGPRSAQIQQDPSGGPPLKPLPTLRAEGGRLLLGPFQLPGMRVPSLY